LRVFDSRIDDPSLEEGSLRDCREIVAGALADFEARIPDRYPPTLSALLAFEDGREEGSKYPNFISTTEVARLSLTRGPYTEYLMSVINFSNHSISSPHR
jgi:hypothetical protein